MKILLISDSHGHYTDIQRAIYNENPERIFFMGDGVEDLKKIEFGGVVDAVLGNNDHNLDYPLEKFVEIYGHKILLTHGHKFFVSPGIKIIAQYAKKNEADIAIFGHTHHRYDDTHFGVRCINPGCICGMYDLLFSYAVMEIDENNYKIEFKEL